MVISSITTVSTLDKDVQHRKTTCKRTISDDIIIDMRHAIIVRCLGSTCHLQPLKPLSYYVYP